MTDYKLQTKIEAENKEFGHVASKTEIANDFRLWAEYVDPDDTMTEEDFDNMSIEEKVKLQEEIYG
jgi:hypothetical protein